VAFFFKVLFDALDEVTGKSFTPSSDDHNVFCMENYTFHLSRLEMCYLILYLCSIYGVSIHYLLQIYGCFGIDFNDYKIQNRQERQISELTFCN
jgi:hypothetical protein